VVHGHHDVHEPSGCRPWMGVGPPAIEVPTRKTAFASGAWQKKLTGLACSWLSNGPAPPADRTVECIAINITTKRHCTTGRKARSREQTGGGKQSPGAAEAKGNTPAETFLTRKIDSAEARDSRRNLSSEAARRPHSAAG